MPLILVLAAVAAVLALTRRVPTSADVVTLAEPDAPSLTVDSPAVNYVPAGGFLPIVSPDPASGDPPTWGTPAHPTDAPGIVAVPFPETHGGDGQPSGPQYLADSYLETGRAAAAGVAAGGDGRITPAYGDTAL